MAGLDFSRPLVAAGAIAGNDWASASAETGLDFTGRAQFRRGLNVQIGLAALATADANLSQFISATAKGNAFASASAGAQIQLPMNFFDEFGIVVGAQAEAQAAVGLEVGLGLSVGDFVALVPIDPDDVGLPIAVLLLLLEEIDIQARFEVSLAAAAMAYASWQITGSVISRPGKPAGLTYRARAGLGCAAGIGFSGGAAAPVKDFRRFYGRATDLIVDDTLRSVRDLLPDSASGLRGPLSALAPVVKTALRTAYELGDYVMKNAPGNSAQDTADLANHCVGIVLEEAQRFLFARMVEGSIGELKARVTAASAALGTAWNRLLPQRQALADLLYQVPAEPFQPTPANATFWRDLLVAGADLAAAIPGKHGDDFRDALAIAYAASELLIEAIASHVNQPHAYALAIGAGVVRTAPSFGGPVQRTPPRAIKSLILARIGASANRILDYADLIQFLVDDIAVDALRQAVPEVDDFLRIFKGPVAATENEVIRLLLTHRHAFLTSGTSSGDADPVGTLDVLLGALDDFLEITVRDLVVPQVNQHLTDPNVRLYFNEVLVATALYTKDVAFKTVLNWRQRPIGRDEFTEALACVLVTLFGRTVVLFGDTFFAALRNDMTRACGRALQRIEGDAGALARLGLPDNALNRSLAVTVLSAGAIVFEPLPEATRARIRECMYEAIEVMPPGGAEDFMAELEDQFFIPNRDRLDALLGELLDLSCERFDKFIRLLFQASGNIVDAAISTFLDEFARIVDEWERRLEETLDGLRKLLQRLEREIEALAARARQGFLDFEEKLEALLESFARTALRNKLRKKIADRIVELAHAELRRNPLYKDLPFRSVKRAARDLVEDVARAAAESPLVDPVFDAIGAIAGVADQILDDAQSLDPSEPLTGQLLGLILDRMEDAVRDSFGGTPHVNLSATFHFEFFGPQSVTFNLGRIDLPFGQLFDAMRSAVNALDFYDDALREAAETLAKAFADTLALAGLKDEQREAQRRQARLDRLKADLAFRERVVAILEPRAETTYNRDFQARIHLGNVPLSFLGLEQDAQQRVFVWLNGILVPPKSLVLGEPIGAISTVAHERDLTISGDRTESGLGGIVLRNGRGGGGAKGSAPKLVARSRRKATPSALAALDATLGDGIDLLLNLAIADLDAGTNTLTVALIDVGGLRYVKTVTFAAAPPPRVPRGKNVLRLPTISGKPPKPSAPKPSATGIVDRTAVTTALAQGAAYVRAQSKLNLPAPRKPR